MPGRSFSHLRRPALGLGRALAAFAGTVLWWRCEPRPDSRKVAVAVFTNRTGDSTLAPLGSMAAVPSRLRGRMPWQGRCVSRAGAGFGRDAFPRGGAG